jgi:hypothetical protein
MAPDPKNRGAHGAIVVPALVTIAAFVVAAAWIVFLFVSASAEARASLVDGVFPREALGMPVLEGFSASGRFGVHLFPGALLFLVVPVLLGLACAVPGVVRFVRGRS